MQRSDNKPAPLDRTVVDCHDDCASVGHDRGNMDHASFLDRPKDHPFFPDDKAGNVTGGFGSAK
jgi:hypothetical protein